MAGGNNAKNWSRVIELYHFIRKVINKIANVVTIEGQRDIPSKFNKVQSILQSFIGLFGVIQRQ